MVMNRDKVLEEMTKLLLSKATMLPYHCGDCKSPLFEKDEKTICPLCGEMKTKREGETEQVKASEHTTDLKTAEVLKKKRDELLAQIEKEKDPKKLVDLLEALEKINKL